MQLYSSNDSKQKIKRNNHRHTKKTNKLANSSKNTIHDNQQFTVQMLSPKNKVYLRGFYWANPLALLRLPFLKTGLSLFCIGGPIGLSRL